MAAIFRFKEIRPNPTRLRPNFQNENSVLSVIRNALKIAGFTSLGLLSSAGLGENRATDSYLDRPELQRFIKEAVQKHGFSEATLKRYFSKVKPRPDIIRLITRPAEDMPWYKYRKLFMSKDRVKKGVAFWRTHEDLIARAQKTYGVPGEIIVAIVGIETFYGERAGTIPILESITTLALDFPRRSAFFRNELLEFLLLTREQGLDPTILKGSYAGAMGVPQFISSSYRKYAVDFNGDGKIDLFNSTADVVGSVANYFKKFGWAPGQRVIIRARVKGEKYKELGEKPPLNPEKTISALRALDIYPKEPLRTDELNQRAALIVLKRPAWHEYWLGLNNFYVISRYNHSTHYSMAVYELSQQLLKERSRSQNRRIRKAKSKNP